MAKFKVLENRLAELLLEYYPIDEIKTLYQLHGAFEAAKKLKVDPLVFLNALNRNKIPIRETLLVNTVLFAEIRSLLPRRKMKHARIHCFEFTGEENDDIRKRICNTDINPQTYEEDRLYFAFRYYSVLDYKTLFNDITVYFLSREDIFKGRGGISNKQKFGRVIDWESELKEFEEIVFF